MGGGKKKSSTLPTITIGTGGLYGSSTAGGSNTFNPTDFQRGLVETSQGGINQYLQQLINPSYSSEPFKARTEQRNRLANRSFESNVMSPLASRGLTRGSNVNAMANSFADTLANLEADAMANEDARVQSVLSSLLNTYQLPYNMMSGLQNRAMGLVGQQAQLDAQNRASRNSLLGGAIGGLGSLVGGMLTPSVEP